MVFLNLRSGSKAGPLFHSKRASRRNARARLRMRTYLFAHYGPRQAQRRRTFLTSKQEPYLKPRASGIKNRRRLIA
jgi:hypothetical protein